MTLEEILKLLRAQPFVPFIIRLSNNSVYTITHPEMILPTPTRLLVGIPAASIPHGGFSDYAIVSMLHIAELIPLNMPTVKSSAANGSN